MKKKAWVLNDANGTPGITYFDKPVSLRDAKKIWKGSDAYSPGT